MANSMLRRSARQLAFVGCGFVALVGGLGLDVGPVFSILQAQESPEGSHPDEKTANDGMVYIPLHNGSADSEDLFQAVAKELHWIAGGVAVFTRALQDGSAERQSIPAATIDRFVSQFPSAFAYHISPGLPTEVANDAHWLAIDTAAVGELLAEPKGRLRNWLADRHQMPLSQLEKVDGTWPSGTLAPPRIVVTLAGIHGLEKSAEAIARAIHSQTNLPTCVLSYPNDAAVKESSVRLLGELEQLHQQYPASRITLVTHSLGGLVARGMLELGVVEAGIQVNSVATRTGVDQLIQVCPPNHGSALSEYAPLLEGFEQLSRLIDRGGNRQQRLLLRMIVDGFNEASLDLDPEAKIYQEFALVERNPDVRYSIIAGDDGPLRPATSRLLNSAWDSIFKLADEPREFDKRVREVVNCTELQQGSGDGVVALSSARLQGVDDFEVLKIHHLTWSQVDTPAGQVLIQALVRRLGIAL